uniref:Uncharacterized protein n=1 Tax=Populus trichocarpa TaxID=3694 RepID=A0A2K1XTD2_POPTR
MNFGYNILAQIFKVFYSRALGFFASSFRRVLLFSKIKAGCLNMGNFLCMPACLLMKCAIFYLFLGLFSFGLSRGVCARVFCVTLTLHETTCLGKVISRLHFEFFSNKRYCCEFLS